MRASLHTDGGARGNPGLAAIGVVLETAGQPVLKIGMCIGRATNNQAEYKALIAGLQSALQAGVTDLSVFVDSELVVRQLHGQYRVKDQKLKLMADEVRKLAGQFQLISFSHVPREHNTQADDLVNQALDNR